MTKPTAARTTLYVHTYSVTRVVLFVTQPTKKPSPHGSGCQSGQSKALQATKVTYSHNQPALSHDAPPRASTRRATVNSLNAVTVGRSILSTESRSVTVSLPR